MPRRIKRSVPDAGRRISSPRSADDSDDTKAPIFSFEHMIDGRCVASCEKADKANLADALHKRSKMTWAEIRQAGRHGLGYEKIGRSAFRFPLPAPITEDVGIIAFRFSGKKPMIGYRDGRIFYIVALDPNFTAYDHGP